MTFIVGLTGGIGSGKSTVAECFRNLGVDVIDADQGARIVVETGTPALAIIAEYFGPTILLKDGALDRAKLRGLIFNDENARQWLESLLHPLIRKWTTDQLASAQSAYAILESPLLLEMGDETRVDRVLVVDLPESIQLARATQRDNNSENQIRAIMKKQLSRMNRLKHADDVINNSGSYENLKNQVRSLHDKYITMAKKQVKDVNQ